MSEISVDDGSALSGALAFLSEAWDELRPEDGNPFSNSGNTFDSPKIQIHAFSWVLDDQPFNLKWRDVVVTWHKWSGRGTYVNRKVGWRECLELMKDGIEAFEAKP